MTSDPSERSQAPELPRQQPVGSGAPVSGLLQSYRSAAAVLAMFNPSELQPLGQARPAEDPAIEQLLEDCTVVYDQYRIARVSLRDDVRHTALQQLGHPGAMCEALDANPDRIRDLLQITLEDYISGKAQPIGKQNHEQLASTLKVVTWLAGILDGLPAPAEVQQQLEIESLLLPYKQLAGSFFRGRQKELAQLRAFVGIPAPGSAPDPQKQATPDKRGPLLIFSPGGMGKSTLLAKFILECVDRDATQRFPFAYLDFDRPDVVAEEPATLLIEATRQISIQYPQDRGIWEGLRDHWLRKRIGSAQASGQLAQQASVLGSSSGQDDIAKMIGEFAERYRSLSVAGWPFLLILDTFEEVQIRDADTVEEIWLFLSELQARLPTLRAIVAGRAIEHPGNPGLELLPLAELDPEAAQGFLCDQGLDPASAAKVVQRIGGNPLSLRLAVDLLYRDSAGGMDIIQNLQLPRFLRRLQDQIVQGLLYWRILDHIHDDDKDLVRLVHPGLVLRRITPEIIAEVLAEPCGIPGATSSRASELFDKLQREISLVKLAPDGALEHRTDVRRVMLDLLKRDQPETVKVIHVRAIGYYEQLPGVQPRAEELYHRLMLCQDRATLDERWQPEAGDLLRNALMELPLQGQNYLAPKIQVVLAPEVRREAELIDWERQTAQRAERRRQKRRPVQALELLRERPDRSALNPLYLLEGQILEQLGRFDEARRVVDAGIDSHSQFGSSAALFNLLGFSARLNESLGDLQRARQALEDAYSLVSRFGDDLSHLEIATARLRLGRSDPSVAAAQLQQMAEQVVAIFAGISDEQLTLLHEHLLRDIAREIGAQYPEVLRRVLLLVGLGATSWEQLVRLGVALDAWDAEQSRAAGEPPGILARAAKVRIAGNPAETWTRFVREHSPTRVSQVLVRLSRHYPFPPPVTELLIMLLQEITFQIDEIEEYLRNDRQLSHLHMQDVALTDSDLIFGTSLAWSYRGYTVRASGKPDSFSGIMYLFNVLVGLEWEAGEEELRGLEHAFRHASDLLFQATKGQMAFGQVVFGGLELFTYPDIQIVASNCIRPRSWLGGLHDPHKYMPIRIGRNFWRSGDQATIAWDEPEGYRAILHEWAHYALELGHHMLTRQPLSFAPHSLIAPGQVLGSVPEGQDQPHYIVLPDTEEEHAPTSSATDADGWAALAEEAHPNRTFVIFQEIADRGHYPLLVPFQESKAPNAPPLPLPQFAYLGKLRAALADQPAHGNACLTLIANLPADLLPDRCWLYVLKGEIRSPDPALEGLIAYGLLKHYRKAEGFQISGAAIGSTIIVIGERSESRAVVLSSRITDGRAGTWQDVTPAEIAQIVASPAGQSSDLLRPLRVHIDGPTPEQIWITPISAGTLPIRVLPETSRDGWVSEPYALPSLDGHIVALWNDQLIISAFSQSGGPPGHNPLPMSPITAGSADGGALLYFDAQSQPSDHTMPTVIITQLHGPAGTLPPGAQLLSSQFAIASDMPLARDLTPTLVMYYTTVNHRLRSTGDTVICRLVDGIWTPIPTYSPSEAAYVAAPLESRAAGKLASEAFDGPRIEYFTICWIPHT